MLWRCCTQHTEFPKLSGVWSCFFLLLLGGICLPVESESSLWYFTVSNVFLLYRLPYSYVNMPFCSPPSPLLARQTPRKTSIYFFVSLWYFSFFCSIWISCGFFFWLRFEFLINAPKFVCLCVELKKSRERQLWETGRGRETKENVFWVGVGAAALLQVTMASFILTTFFVG